MGIKTGIWLDSEHAYLIRLTGSGVEVEALESGIETRVRIEGEKKSYSRLGGSWFNPQKKKTKRQKQQTMGYFRRIINKCRDAEEVFLFGPAELPRGLYKMWVQTKSYHGRVHPPESASKMTRNQMIARVREFFS